jgi:Flp pilus assembly protein TadD
MGCRESAEATFRQALELEPDFDEALANLGRLLSMTNPAAGIPLLRRALELDPEYAFAHSCLAHALSAADQKDGAVYHYREAIRCNPESADYCVNLALELMLVETSAADTEAESALRRAIQLDPTSAVPLRVYAMFLEFGGRVADAKRLYRDALATDPTDEMAARRLARLEDRKQ